ncbi:probable ubiquitin-conjugating enzyme E2 23 [Panicum virgatum]|uniref:probable ubiquitin-conjugating enzyme E2 23 n=1 Tax=Panicum virgatum TaxID=38727 RepID=UPI0019D59A95|nr:probable ubiquitin-conjugating enzyme E2 23 [Panicum virgatum]
MEDASGRSICQFDLVAFKSRGGGAHGDRGRVMNPRPGEGNTLSVLCLCVDGSKVRVEPSKITVVDRSYLYPGIVVASASDPGGQLGVVTGVERALDLVRLDGENNAAAPVAGGVSPGELRRVRALSLGDYVVSGPWLGRVVEVSLDVDVAFDDGAVCRVADACRKLRCLRGGDGLSRLRNSAFYPGQLVVGHRSVFRASPWLEGYWKPSRERGTVAKVEMAGVLVYWVASSSTTTDIEASAPPAYQRNPQSLTFFCSSPSCFWTIGDRCFFRTPGGHRAPPADDKEQLTKSNQSRPGRMAMKRIRRGVDRSHAEFERPMSVASTRTTADVLWQDGTRQRGVASTSLLPFGSLKTMGDDLSWVGHVSDLCEDGHVLVKWGNDNTTKVLPHEIAVVKLQMVGEMLREMGDWVYDDGDMDDDNNAREETAAQEPAGITDDGANGEGDDDDSDTEDGLVPPNRATAGSLFLLQRVIQIASGVLARCRKHIVREPAALAQRSASCTDGNGDEDGGGGAAAAAAAASASGNGGGDGDGSARQGVDDSFRFQQFDVMQSPPDHHYLDSTEQRIGGGRKWIKRVHKEWNILENCLPDTVYVRAYEDRTDLLRVVMVGASGTPYYDGLFFFDLQLPPSYPAAPPSVNYRSFGLRVNPNLYPSGTVCLSLLNTFGGQGAELWSPEASSVLQVVVSIQGLVLNAQPYYNEAGYETQVGTLGGEARAADQGRSSAGFRLALARVVPRLVEAFAAIGADGCEEFDRLRL